MVERKTYTIVKMARNVLHAQNLYKSFWTEAVANAVYTRNQCPTRALDSMTPEEACNEWRPIFQKYHKSVGCEWLFHTKMDALSKVVMHKAWLVAKG